MDNMCGWAERLFIEAGDVGFCTGRAVGIVEQLSCVWS